MSITVPFGKFDAYEVHVASTETDLTDVGSEASTTDADGYFVAGIGLVKLINHATSSPDGTVTSPGFMYELTAFKGSNDHLDFIQNPLDAAVGDTIKPPVTVSVKDAQQNIDTNASGSITLSIGTSTGTGKLTGTLTEPIVNGIATFPDLSIDSAGTYKLAANDPVITDGTLSADFNVTNGKLVYLQAPHDGAVNTSLNPGVIVEVVDSKGNLLTTSDGATVTLQTIGFTGQADLTGNIATIESGKAVFPSLTFKQAGSYTLQATDSANDTFVNAGPFKITGDTIKFVTQPKNTDVKTAIPIKLELLDKDGHVDSKADGSLTFSLNTISGGANATLSGTITMTFVKGIAIFTAKAGPMVSAPGVYTLTATKDDNSTNTPSSQFTVAGAHLVIKKLPKSLDAGANANPPIQVQVVDAKNKVITTNNDAIQLGFNLPSETFQGSPVEHIFTATAVKGIATFTGGVGSDVRLTLPGTYAVRALDQTDDAANNGNDTITPGTGSLVVAGEHLVIKSLPKSLDAGANAKPPVLVQIVNTKGKVITSNTDDIQIGFSLPSETFNGSPVEHQFTATAIKGVATFTGGVGSDVHLTLPGTYSVRAFDVTDENKNNGTDTITPATGSLVVAGDHLVIKNLPKSLDAGANANPPVLVQIVNSKGKVITDNVDDIQLGFSLPGETFNGSPVEHQFAATAVNGVATFTGGVGADVHLSLPGTYDVRAFDVTDESKNTGTDTITPATGSLVVAGDHLVIKRLPKSTDVGATISSGVEVDVVSAKGKLITTNNDSIQIGFMNPSDVVDGQQIERTFTSTAVNGVAIFSDSNAIHLDTAGTYDVRAFDPVAATDSAGNSAIVEATTSIIVNPDKLVIKNLARTATVGVAITSIQVAIENSKGQLVTSKNDTINLGFLNPADMENGQTLQRIFTATAVNGIATFNTGTATVLLNLAGTYSVTAEDTNDPTADTDAPSIQPASGSITLK